MSIKSLLTIHLKYVNVLVQSAVCNSMYKRAAIFHSTNVKIHSFYMFCCAAFKISVKRTHYCRLKIVLFFLFVSDGKYSDELNCRVFFHVFISNCVCFIYEILKILYFIWISSIFFQLWLIHQWLVSVEVLQNFIITTKNLICFYRIWRIYANVAFPNGFWWMKIGKILLVFSKITSPMLIF